MSGHIYLGITHHLWIRWFKEGPWAGREFLSCGASHSPSVLLSDSLEDALQDPGGISWKIEDALPIAPGITAFFEAPPEGVHPAP
jgi:hypothetical protein